MEELITAVERIGLAPAFLVMIAIGAGYSLRRLFGVNGIVTGLGTRFVQHVDRLEEIQGGQMALCKQMHTLHVDPNGPCNTTCLRRAGAHAADALGAIGDATGADVTLHVEAIKRELDSPLLGMSWPQHPPGPNGTSTEGV